MSASFSSLPSGMLPRSNAKNNHSRDRRRWTSIFSQKCSRSAPEESKRSSKTKGGCAFVSTLFLNRRHSGLQPSILLFYFVDSLVLN